MKRRRFIRQCTYAAFTVPAASFLLPSCSPIYYAQLSRDGDVLSVPRTEFIRTKKDKQEIRPYVLLSIRETDFPICLYRQDEQRYTAVLLECTHRGCALNVGGGLYTCPCHGSEFSMEGKVLEGPAVRDLKRFTTKHDKQNIYVYLS